ncbi:9529_t:CDS:2, partial [Entrophospora sp. SA101]
QGIPRKEIILTKEEIRKAVGNLDRNLEEKCVREIQDYFEYQSFALEHLKDKKFKN